MISRENKKYIMFHKTGLGFLCILLIISCCISFVVSMLRMPVELRNGVMAKVTNTLAYQVNLDQRLAKLESEMMEIQPYIHNGGSIRRGKNDKTAQR